MTEHIAFQQGVRWTIGLLGAEVPSQGMFYQAEMLRDIRLDMIERRILRIEAALEETGLNVELFANLADAQGIVTGTDETLQAAQPEGLEPDPVGDAP